MIRVFTHYVVKNAFTLLLFNLLILLVSATLVSTLWLADGQYSSQADSFYMFALVIVLSISTLDLYQHDSREDAHPMSLRLIPSLAITYALLNVLNYLVPVSNKIIVRRCCRLNRPCWRWSTNMMWMRS